MKSQKHILQMFVITFAAKYTTNKHLAAWLFNVNNNFISARGWLHVHLISIAFEKHAIVDNIVSLSRALCCLIMIPPWLLIHWLTVKYIQSHRSFENKLEPIGSALIDFQSRLLRISDWESGFSIRLMENQVKVRMCQVQVSSPEVSSPRPSPSPSPQVASPSPSPSPQVSSPSPKKRDSSRTYIFEVQHLNGMSSNTVRPIRKWIIQYGSLQTGNTNISASRWDRNEIPTATPTFLRSSI